ncbi:MAG: hypothetical protein GYA35_01520 [Thermoanaerobaculaceae bacterium]|nr:hypothetical protein [Thermoanaerobaculaceae bacterium]
MRFRQAENGEAIYRNIRKKILQKGNFARRFLIMFQVAEGKLPADCLVCYLPFSLMKVFSKIYSFDKSGLNIIPAQPR